MQHELNLITTAWLPVLRHSGPAVIRPAQITEGLNDDPALAIDWPRPDFRIATLEFLIGLLATACPPSSHQAWHGWWQTPPVPDELDAAFAPFAHAFVLDGDGPRFLQDRDELVADIEPVERLLIEAPGGSTTSKNTDLLVKRGVATTLSRATAAITLFTFQSWAPAGGAGNRVGLRGGGPLTTFVIPDRTSLWHLLWANVPLGTPPAAEALARVFPWLAPTLTSEGNRTVVPEADAHPLQAWWGMPRRIRLNFESVAEPRPCDITGQPETRIVTGWRQRPRGPNYAQWGRRHPLAPHYQVKADSEWLPVHPQPGGIGYRHWLGLVVDTAAKLPAASIATWKRDRLRDSGADPYGAVRLLAAGYDMDNMKARAFVESEMPLPGSADPDDQEQLDALARALVESAEAAASLLRSAVRAALFSPGATVKADSEVLSTVRERLWDATEARFFNALETAARRPADDGEPEPERRAWLDLLRLTALALFDEAAPLAPEAGSAAPRIARARRFLRIALRGYGRDGTALFKALGLPLPEKAPRTPT